MADHDAPSQEERDDPVTSRYREEMARIRARRRPGVLSPAFAKWVLGPIGLLLAGAAVAMAGRDATRAAVLGAMAGACLVLSALAWRRAPRSATAPR